MPKRTINYLTVPKPLQRKGRTDLRGGDGVTAMFREMRRYKQQISERDVSRF